MSETDNKAIIRRFVEDGLNKRNAALIDEVWSAEYLGHDPERPTPRRIEDVRQGMVGMLGKVFPDAQYSIESLVAEGDLVVWHWTFRATHQGELMGIPPTGKPNRGPPPLTLTVPPVMVKYAPPDGPTTLS